MKVALVRKENQETPGWVRPELEAAGFQLVERVCSEPREVVEVAADADILWDLGGVKAITAEILPELRRCGAIIRGGSGTDNIPVAEATALGIIVANTPDATAVPVAEHTVALILSVLRRIPAHERAVRRGTWDPETPYPELLHGRTVGLVGFGRIARAVAARLRAFGTRLLACDPMVDPALMAEHRVEGMSLEEMLPASDIVSVHTPLLPATRHLIGRRELGLMKPSAILINTSRGGVVDSAALFEALENGGIAAAGLDVLEQEPPGEDPLIGLPNTLVTPHSAGYHPALMEQFCRLAVATVIDLSQKRWPVSYVNPGVEPRWEMEPEPR